MHIKVYKENIGALTLASSEPQHMTLCSNHYTINYHWFWECVHSCQIKLLKIDLPINLGTCLQKVSLPLSLFICNPYWCVSIFSFIRHERECMVSQIPVSLSTSRWIGTGASEFLFCFSSFPPFVLGSLFSCSGLSVNWLLREPYISGILTPIFSNSCHWLVTQSKIFRKTLHVFY